MTILRCTSLLKKNLKPQYLVFKEFFLFQSGFEISGAPKFGLKHSSRVIFKGFEKFIISENILTLNYFDCRQFKNPGQVKKTNNGDTMHYCYFDSPLGKLLLNGNQLLEGLHFPTGKTRIEPEKDWVYNEDLFLEAINQLDAYFKGERTEFDLKLNIQGTHFQKKVWQQLLKIPYGETISYGELAKRIGNPKASRAVGMANGKNPISIIVPCHRVIGKDGSLTGFGGGIEVKKNLIEMEKGIKKIKR